MQIYDVTTVTGQIYFDNSSLPRELPLLVADGKPFLPLLKYQLENLKQKLSWHERLNFSVRLLMEYAEANPELIEDSRHLFVCFVNRLLEGTIDSSGNDTSLLFWVSRKKRECRQIVSMLTTFSRFLAKFYAGTELNPAREASFNERIMKMAASRYRSDNNFLKHLDSSIGSDNAMSVVNTISAIGDDPVVFSDGHVNFPEADFPAFLLKGFEVNPFAAEPLDRIHLKAVLITLLMWGGGIRTSEAFHLWLEDVQEHPEDPTVAWVRIGHPHLQKKLWLDGGTLRSGTRSEYLRTIGFVPRDTIRGTRLAGWKNPALDRKFELEIHWSDPEYGRLFFFLWKKYLDRIEQIGARHPWAFIVERAGKGYGEPYAIDDFRTAFKEALERIGLKQDPGKGHNPHGCRHAYAVRLKERKLKPQIIQRCLHHASIKSQRVYTDQEYIEMNNELTAGRGRAEANSIETASAMLDRFEKMLLR